MSDLAYQKVNSIYRYRSGNKPTPNRKAITELALQYDLGEIAAPELLTKIAPLAEKDAIYEEVLKALDDADIPGIEAIRLSEPERFYSEISGQALITKLIETKHPYFKEKFIKNLEDGSWPNNYTDSDEIDEIAPLTTDPEIQKVLNEKISTEQKCRLIQFLSKEEKGRLIARFKEKYSERKSEEEEALMSAAKNGARRPELAPYLASTDPYFVELKDDFFRNSHGTGRGDKARMQQLLPHLDINSILGGGFWVKATPMNKLSLLSHPKLPKELFVKAMKLLAVYFNNPKNRELPVKIGRVMNWDDIRELIALGVGVRAVEKIDAVEPVGQPLTDEEINRWAFPELMKTDKRTYEGYIERWKMKVNELAHPNMRRLKDLDLTKLRLWHSLVADADKPKAMMIIKKVLIDEAKWKTLVDDIVKIEPNLFDLQFSGNTIKCIGPKEI